MPMALAVGTVTNLCIRALKFSVIDISKELVFKSINQNKQLSAKTSIDGVVVALGRSGVAMLTQVLLITFGSLSAMTPIAALLVTGILIVWSQAVNVVHQSLPMLPSPAKEKVAHAV